MFVGRIVQLSPEVYPHLSIFSAPAGHLASSGVGRSIDPLMRTI